jgi:magnesium chelatase subunit I
VDSANVLKQLAKIQGLMEKTGGLGLGASEPDAVRASAAEFILEGLYAHRRISRNEELGFTAGERKREPPEGGEGRRPPRKQFN